MRIIVDYRPALRARSGVGEYVHQTARALALRYPDDSLTLFTSFWKDRPEPGVASACPGAGVSDHRFPVSVLNFAWHQLEWPSIELVNPPSVRRRLFTASAAAAHAARRAGGDGSRPRLPAPPRAHAARDPARLPALGRPACPPRQPRHRPMAVHGCRSGRPAGRAAPTRCCLPAGYARVARSRSGPLRDWRVRSFHGYARTEKERGRVVGGVRQAARAASERAQARPGRQGGP